METFATIDLGAVINNNVRLAAFQKPTPVQKYAIPIILQKRDLMACAQTGTLAHPSCSLDAFTPHSTISGSISYHLLLTFLFLGSGKTGAFLFPLVSLTLSDPPPPVEQSGPRRYPLPFDIMRWHFLTTIF